jgi:hypothetical protein
MSGAEKTKEEGRAETGSGLFRFAPDDVLVVTAIDHRVNLAGGSVTKENSAFDTFAEENL